MHSSNTPDNDPIPISVALGARAFVALALLSSAAIAQVARPRSSTTELRAEPGSTLERTARTTLEPLARIGSTNRVLPICDREGRVVATRSVTGESVGARPKLVRAASPFASASAEQPAVRIESCLPGGADLVAPAYRSWIASPDGRTLVGAGDPSAPEHPFQVEVSVFRDGQRVAFLDEELGIDTAMSVGVDGRVALVARPAGDSAHWFAAVLDADGTELFRTPLPVGMQGRDPVLTRSGVLVRVHSMFGEGVDGEIVRVEVGGSTSVLSAPEAVGLVGFDGSDHALVVARDELLWVDVESGRVSWRTHAGIRRASPDAWTLWRTSSGEWLGVLATNVQRRGQPRPPITLLVIDTVDGALRASVDVEAPGAPGEMKLVSNGDELWVDGYRAREVYGWSR